MRKPGDKTKGPRKEKAAARHAPFREKAFCLLVYVQVIRPETNTDFCILYSSDTYWPYNYCFVGMTTSSCEQFSHLPAVNVFPQAWSAILTSSKTDLMQRSWLARDTGYLVASPIIATIRQQPAYYVSPSSSTLVCGARHVSLRQNSNSHSHACVHARCTPSTHGPGKW